MTLTYKSYHIVIRHARHPIARNIKVFFFKKTNANFNAFTRAMTSLPSYIIYSIILDLADKSSPHRSAHRGLLNNELATIKPPSVDTQTNPERCFFLTIPP